MKSPQIGPIGTDAANSRSRTTKRVVPVATPVLLSVVATAVSSSAAGTSSSHKTLSTTAKAPKDYFSKTGTRSTSLAVKGLSKAWTVTWAFDCQVPSTTGTFALPSDQIGKTVKRVTDQTGLGGGGHKPFTGAAWYKFGVTTTCGWRVSVGSTPSAPLKTDVTTTSLSPKKSTTTTSGKSKVVTTTTAKGRLRRISMARIPEYSTAVMACSEHFDDELSGRP